MKCPSDSSAGRDPWAPPPASGGGGSSEPAKKRQRTSSSSQAEASSSSQPPPAPPGDAREVPDLGEDTMFEVLRRAEPRTLAAAACVSRGWRVLAQDERLWEAPCVREWTVDRPRLLGTAAPRRRALFRRLPPPARHLHPGPTAVRRWLRELARRADAGTGEEEGGAVDRRRAQVVSLRPEDVRKRGLEENITQLRADEDADAGGQPRSEVLYQAQLRDGKEVEHPRHHHSSPDRRPASLAVPVIDDQPVQRTGSARQRGSSRCQPTPSSTARRARPSVRRTGLSGCRTTAGFARSRPAVWFSTMST
ncbi:hypothetical protein VPH35_048044 [Triticum aestivum]|uniref:F-box protein n=1 Tax=Triticum aestivum TaxID=4565 RepID=A0A3B6EQQ6_WHEAT